MKIYRAGHIFTEDCTRGMDYNWYVWVRNASDPIETEKEIPYIATFLNRDVSSGYGDGGLSDCAVSILAHHFQETKEQVEAPVSFNVGANAN